MNLDEIKKNTLKLIEEYSNETTLTDDIDIKNKLIFGINSVINEIVKIHAIKRTYSYNQKTELESELPRDVSKITKVTADGKINHFWEQKERSLFVLATNKQITVFYDAFPPIYSDLTPGNENLPFENNVCLIIPFGVAKIILMATGQTNEATECETKYYQYLQELENTAGKTVVKIKNIFGGAL